MAVRVQILDVDLNNKDEFDNSFALKTGNTFIVNKSGQMLVNFGSLKPPSTAQAGLPGMYETDAAGNPIGSPLVGAGRFALPNPAGQVFVDSPRSGTPFRGSPTLNPYPYNPSLPPLAPGVTIPGGGVNQFDPSYGSVFTPEANISRYAYNRPGFGPFSSPAQPGILADGTSQVPQNFEYPKNQFFDFVTAQITGSSAKVLADPTLIVQESESSSVGVGRTYTTRVDSSSSSTGVISCDQIKETAGLEVDVSVARVDDNGFVTLKVNPTLKAPAGNPEPTTCNDVLYQIQNLSVRELKTGEFRVRDSQTLILTGVIQDDVKAQFTKWPILGDIPLIGQFFRKTTDTREKRELVIIVTPKIINDDQGGSYGYGYQPKTKDAKELIYQP